MQPRQETEYLVFLHQLMKIDFNRMLQSFKMFTSKLRASEQCESKNAFEVQSTTLILIKGIANVRLDIIISSNLLMDISYYLGSPDVQVHLNALLALKTCIENPKCIPYISRDVVVILLDLLNNNSKQMQYEMIYEVLVVLCASSKLLQNTMMNAIHYSVVVKNLNSIDNKRIICSLLSRLAVSSEACQAMVNSNLHIKLWDIAKDESNFKMVIALLTKMSKQSKSTMAIICQPCICRSVLKYKMNARDLTFKTICRQFGDVVGIDTDLLIDTPKRKDSSFSVKTN